MTDHIVEVPQKVLSPAAQAVLDAFLNGYICNSADNSVAFQADRNGIAAALRAAANQDPDGLNTSEYEEGWGEAMATLRTIAAELENAQ